jgi:hypothetical protein
MSWKPEVIADNTGKWCGNGLRFATEKEAHENAHDLMMRWMAVKEYRAAPSDDPVNYSYEGRTLRAVPETKQNDHDS